MSHHREGSGEPLVLIHGLGSRWQLWQPVLPLLRGSFDVVALDLPGFGASAAVGAADVGTFADAVTAFAAGAFPHAATFHVAGSSLGGGVALELGRRGVARSVTAFAPIGFWGPVSRRWCQVSVTAARGLGRLARPVLPALAATRLGRVALFGMFFGHPGRLDPAAAVADVDALVAAPGFAAARAAFAGHRFPGAGAGAVAGGGLVADGSAVAGVGALGGGVPVTVAWGSRDAILPAFQARRAAGALPSARHVRLAGCGHLPFSDEPAVCADLIRTTAGAA
ncbi:alpha/beta fold hydrolase [Dactylosporangium aurantiacum]|uniref:Alpha/beta fold hydrolase n=1 Tax=Dactylosporangium aurantiacum TaxID=35754 RepID=A0A9Q9MME8_9ACTN|nr:alpha/beta fold hydrolase [Dactylosporangium aurantiacum]